MCLFKSFLEYKIVNIQISVFIALCLAPCPTKYVSEKDIRCWLNCMWNQTTRFELLVLGTNLGILGKLLSSLGLNILICKMGIVVVMVSKDFYVDEMSYLYMYKCLNTETGTWSDAQLTLELLLLLLLCKRLINWISEGPSFLPFPLVCPT